jgi:hypothetical protein
MELVKGLVIPCGYRINRVEDRMLSSWSFHGSTDGVIWMVIDKVQDCQAKDALTMRSCETGTAFKRFKIVSEERNETKLRLKHFDVFGRYFENS